MINLKTILLSVMFLSSVYAAEQKKPQWQEWVVRASTIRVAFGKTESEFAITDSTTVGDIKSQHPEGRNTSCDSLTLRAVWTEGRLCRKKEWESHPLPDNQLVKAAMNDRNTDLFLLRVKPYAWPEE